MAIKVKAGDYIEFTQENGERLGIIVYPDGVCIKAEAPWTNLCVDRRNRYMVKATVESRLEQK